jgi:hypothetical protein
VSIKNRIYDRHSTVDLEEAICAIQANLHINGKKIRVVLNGIAVKCVSLRLRTFATKGTVCAFCGLEATHFAIERPLCDAGFSADEKPYHLNLWGINESGEEILFTHDHIHARSSGGRDHISNTQTMCTVCNNEKSVEEGRLAKALRGEYGATSINERVR